MLKPTRLNDVTFRFKWAKEARERHFVETGNNLGFQGDVVINQDDLSPEQRELLLRWEKVARWYAGAIYLGAVTVKQPPALVSPSWLHAKPGIEVVASERLAAPTPEEAWGAFADMVAAAEEARAESERLFAEARDAKQRFEEQQARAQIEREAREAEKRQKMLTVTFDENGEALIDLYTTVTTAAGIDMDTRFTSNYVKRITGINPSLKHSKMFEGEYVTQGTAKINREPALFLVAGTSGSRKHSRTDYAIVRFQDGRFEPTGVTANGDDPGWYLLLGGPVQNLLDSMKPAAEEPETDLAQALGEALAYEMRGEDIPVDLKETLIALL